jgi:hypothetical protein
MGANGNGTPAQHLRRYGIFLHYASFTMGKSDGCRKSKINRGDPFHQKWEKSKFLVKVAISW